jgi:phospholipid/cholesterol/gamma-HCH transport system substrate-binding protein
MGAFGILAFFTLMPGHNTIFGAEVEKTVYFERAHGLRKGDAVHVAGMRWGRVAQITYDQAAPLDRRIVVVVALEDEVRLSRDYEIKIEDATLLGGRVLTIDPGPADSPDLAADADLSGTVAPNVMEAVNELVADNRDALTEAIGGVRDLVSGVQDGRGALGPLFVDDELGADLKRGVAKAADTFENVDKLTADLVAGKGTIGRLLAEDEVYRSLTAIGEDLEAILTDVREGDGVVAALLGDEEMRKNVSEGLADLREVVGKINDGQGSIGRLVNDDKIVRDLEIFTQRLASEDSTVGRLFASDDLYVQIQGIAEDVAAITAKVRAGEGTVGKLVMEEEMYDELMKAVGLVTRSLEEYREAAPITTFTSVMFGAF